LTERICEVRGLHKAYHKSGDKLPILRGVDLDLYAGDMCSIVGQSGVGKSTLLHILGALDRPSQGTVTYFGQDIFQLPEPELARFRNDRIGFIFQFHHLLPELTAVENVALPAMIARERRSQAMDQAAALLKDVGLGHRIKHRPGELSGGEQQRVAIARALIRSPRMVLADEPTGNLDQGTSDEIHELLVKINREKGVAFVVVTHNRALASLMNRQLVMQGGLVYEGAP
jgi:lipoprotein-releasing system ATP-binding protein